MLVRVTAINFRALAAAAVLLAALPSAVFAQSYTDKLRDFFVGPPAAPQQPGVPKQAEIDCPAVDVRAGASTVTVHGAGEPVATNVRYQATIGDTARECLVRGPTLTMKVGVQGRILLGPAGGPGKLDVPMRLALVHEGPEPKTLWTKLYRIPVPIPAGQTSVPFTHIEPDLTVPKPNASDAESYILYVGFDQGAAKEPAPKRKPSAPRQ